MKYFLRNHYNSSDQLKASLENMNLLCRHEDDDPLDDFSSWRYPGCPDDLATWQFDLKQELVVEEQHPLITRARCGDLIRVMVYVEDRHGLEVRDCQMTLLHIKILCRQKNILQQSNLIQSRVNLVDFGGNCFPFFDR